MIQHPNIDPVALDLGFAQIHWYGVMYLCAFMFAYWILKFKAKKGLAPFQAEQVDDIIFYGAMGVILGGRFGYVFFYGFENFLNNPASIIRVWEGGMSFHGGFIGVVIALALYCKKYKIQIGAMFDMLALAVPMGLFFGRMGNFIGQELWGRPTDGPWGMVFPKDASGLPRHASQLYEAVLEGLVLFLIIYWFARKPRPQWATGALFIIGYGFFRFLVEFVRQPDSHIGFDLFDWMSRGQILSLPMILIGVIVMAWAYRRGEPLSHQYKAIKK
ncbi:MAG: prolipoprotein diacylglyceryl transferase [Pseudomonadales bacterium]|nr:prolipoprotein diacylglyceryl transferase [Pseudomonadales bacterium]